MLYAYSDCSKRNDRVVVTAALVANKTFIDYDMEVLEGVKDTGQGELRAIMLAMDLVNRNFDDKQRVLIQSDCKSIVEQYAWSLRYRTVPKSRLYRADWNKLMAASAKHFITAKHIAGHQDNRSWNVICDLGARAML